MRAWLIPAWIAFMLVPAVALAQDVPGTREEPAACAEAAFARAEAERAAFGEIDVAVRPNLAGLAAIDSVLSQIRDTSSGVHTLAQGYDTVVDCRSPEWSLAAFVRQGQLYEAFAAATQRAMGQRGYEGVRRALEAQLRPVECLAVVRYVLAVRMARAGGLFTPLARTALDRLVHYTFSTAQSCVTAPQARDSTFTPLTLSDLAPYRE